MRRLLVLTLILFGLGCGNSTAPTRHTVVITPENIQVWSGATQQFKAEVLPAGSDQGVNWNLGGIGSISSTGLYQAPSNAGTAENDIEITLTATSPTHGVSGVARIRIPSAASLVLGGWEQYLLGNSDEAQRHFDAAFQTVENYAPARAALAWIAYWDGDVVGAQVIWEELAAAGDVTSLGALVLLAAQNHQPQGIIDSGLRLLQRDPSYVFPGDQTYSASDIRWLVARAGLDLANYAVTATQLNILVPGNSLNPNAASFPEDALALLESIQGTV